MPVPYYDDEEDDLEPVRSRNSGGDYDLDDEDDDEDLRPSDRSDSGDEEEDEEDEPDPEERRRLNAERAREGNRRRQDADALARNGIAIQNGVPVIVNQALYDGWMQAQGRGKEPAKEAEEELGPPPDATLEPEAFNEWLAKRDAQTEKRILDKVDARLQTVQPAVQEQSLERAFKVARAVLPEYGLGDLLDHPELEKALGAALQRSGFEPHEWRDPDVIARVAGVINPLLRKTLPKRGNRRRPDDTGRGYGALTPSRGGGAREEPAQRTEQDRRGARRLGVSETEWDALGQESYDVWKQQQDRERRQQTAREERRGRK